MSELAGKLASIGILGAPVAMIGEPCTNSSEDGKTWQITDITKRILDNTEPVLVYGMILDAQLVTGTTTTILKIPSHGLVVGDAIINTYCSNAFRVVLTVPDADTFTVASVTGQKTGDVIAAYRKVSASHISYVNGIVNTSTNFGSVYISASYLTQSIVATAHEFTYAQGSDMAEVTPFLSEYKKRIPVNKFTYGTLSTFDVTDTFFSDALLADTPKYLSLNSGGGTSKVLLAYFDKTELKAAIGNPQTETVSFISAND